MKAIQYSDLHLYGNPTVIEKHRSQGATHVAFGSGPTINCLRVMGAYFFFYPDGHVEAHIHIKDYQDVCSMSYEKEKSYGMRDFYSFIRRKRITLQEKEPLSTFAVGWTGETTTEGALLRIVDELPASNPAPVIDEEPTVSIAPRQFPIWKKVRIGLPGLHRDTIISQLTNIDCRFDQQALDKMINFAVRPQVVSLVKVSVRELGFPKGTILADILTKAYECGLQPVLGDAAISLRLNYLDQPVEEFLQLITAEIKPSIITIGRDNHNLILNRGDYFYGYCQSPDDLFIFRQSVPRL